MPKIYTWQFHARIYELDEASQIKLTTYQNYLEEAATQASASNGFDYAWYRAHKRVWVVRKITVRYYTPAAYRDELVMQTWVSDFRRVQSHREYDLHRVSDGAHILRARTNWVYLDAETRSPTRLPDDFRAAFEPSGEIEELDARVLDPIKVERAVTHAEERCAQHNELDSGGHVNNAVYVGWAEQAIQNALRAAGWPPERLAAAAFSMTPLGREIEYLRSAVEGDCLRLETRLVEVGHDRAAWRTDIRQAESGELLVTDMTVRAFSDMRGARSIPDDLLLSLVTPVHPRG